MCIICVVELWSLKACSITCILYAARSQRYCGKTRILLGGTSVVLNIERVMLLSALDNVPIEQRKYFLKEMDK